MTLLDVAMAHAARSRRRRRSRASGRRHDRDEDELHAPGLRPAGRAPAGAARAPRRWRSARHRCSTPKRRALAHATGTFKYLEGPAGGRQGASSALERIRLNRGPPWPDRPTSRSISSSRPERRGEHRQLPPGRGAGRQPADGQVLVRNHFLSLDPYMRGRMNDAKSYAQPQPLNEVMQRRHGRRGGRVEAPDLRSRATACVGMGGWQQYAWSTATQPGALRKVDTTPHSAVGLPRRGRHAGRDRVVRPDEDLRAEGGPDDRRQRAPAARSAARVGQLAKARGCRAVGIAGGADKCRYVTDELGFDACIDYKAHADLKSLYAGAEGGDAGRRRRLLRERRRR